MLSFGTTPYRLVYLPLEEWRVESEEWRVKSGEFRVDRGK